jgi:hypothetical protein
MKESSRIWLVGCVDYYLTLADAAAKIGTGVRAVRDAENGRASASIGTYWAILWAYDLLDPANELADPSSTPGV